MVHVGKSLSLNGYNVTIILPRGSRFVREIENTTVIPYYIKGVE